MADPKRDPARVAEVAASPVAAGDQEQLAAAMAAYQAGELDGFRRLYGLLAADLRRYFRRAAGDLALAEDLVQEAFLQIHRSRHTYQPELPVRPWIFGIARHVAGRFRREALRRGRHEGAALASFGDDELAAPAAPALSSRDLAGALARLPPGRRDAWLLHHVHGFSFPEIARRLRIGVSAAKLRSSRAMRALRAAFGVGADLQEPEDE